MIKTFRHLWRDRRGGTAIEYGLIVALIVIVVVTGIRGVGGTSGSIWDNMSAKYANAG